MSQQTRILHILSQRPSRTGSGVTLDSIVRLAKEMGYDQRVVVGTPKEDDHPVVGTLAKEHIFPLVFESEKLPYPVPGMSDVMPYRSTVWSTMSEEQLDHYRQSWRKHLNPILSDFKPHLIHSHHIWILSSLLKDLAPNTPIVTHCHATGLRQMKLCPHLTESVVKSCRRNDRFFVLHQGHGQELQETLQVHGDRVINVGAGFRQDIFHRKGRTTEDGIPKLVYAGKYSHSKGVPSLLKAFSLVSKEYPNCQLHIAGTGTGAEADELRQKMEAMAPRLVLHGQLKQDQLADLFRQCDIFVLPSFYEGLPLVLIEALACGCRPICTDLPGVEAHLAPHLPNVLELVPLPPLVSVDKPEPRALPQFEEDLARAISLAIKKGKLTEDEKLLSPFTWRAIFQKIESQWQKLL